MNWFSLPFLSREQHFWTQCSFTNPIFHITLFWTKKKSLFHKRSRAKGWLCPWDPLALPCGTSSRSCWVERLLKTQFWCQLGDNTCRIRLLDGACVLNQDSIWGWFFQRQSKHQSTQVKVSAGVGFLYHLQRFFSPFFSALGFACLKLLIPKEEMFPSGNPQWPYWIRSWDYLLTIWGSSCHLKIRLKRSLWCWLVCVWSLIKLLLY